MAADDNDKTWTLIKAYEPTGTTSSTSTPTSTGASPAATTSSSAATALRATSFGGWIKHVDNLGGHGGMIGLLLVSISLVLIMGSFLS